MVMDIKIYTVIVTCYFRTGGSQTISWGGRASSDSEAKALAKAEAKSRIKDCREYAPKIIDKR